MFTPVTGEVYIKSIINVHGISVAVDETFANLENTLTSDGTLDAETPQLIEWSMLEKRE